MGNIMKEEKVKDNMGNWVESWERAKQWVSKRWALDSTEAAGSETGGWKREMALCWVLTVLGMQWTVEVFGGCVSVGRWNLWTEKGEISDLVQGS